jgi:hypothetical protein
MSVFAVVDDVARTTGAGNAMFGVLLTLEV